MRSVVIDTNVMVVANGRSAAPQATEECVIRCQARLADILRGSEKVLLDDKKRMIQEYKNNLNEKGRGHGDQFWLELVRRMWREQEKFIRVRITPLAENGADFEEFPVDDALSGFDPDDRKFIAVALAHKRDAGKAPTILLAIDRGWLQFMDTLENYGVRVDLICEDDMHHLRQGRKRT